MFSVAFAAAASLALLVFCFFLAEELDIRHSGAPEFQDDPWLPVFLPLLCVVVASVVFALISVWVARRKRRAAATMTNDETRERIDATTRVVLVDATVDLVLAALFVLLLLALIAALGSQEPARALWAFEWAEALFVLLFVALLALTIVGAWRTANEYYLETSEVTCATSCFWWTSASKTAQATAASIRQDQNTRSPTARAHKYDSRMPFQHNKLVYAAALEATPNKWVDGVHIVLLVLHAVAVLIATLLVFARARQVTRVELSSSLLSSPLLTSTTATTATTATTMLHATLQHGLQFPQRDDVHHALHAVTDWHRRVLPLAVAFIPLFITHGLLIAYALLVQTTHYCMQRVRAIDWLRGAAYLVTFSMLLLFEALLAARVDVGALQHASWHNTFAPLYTAFIFNTLFLGGTELYAAAYIEWKPTSGSRWGVVV